MAHTRRTYLRDGKKSCVRRTRLTNGINCATGTYVISHLNGRGNCGAIVCGWTGCWLAGWCWMEQKKKRMKPAAKSGFRLTGVRSRSVLLELPEPRDSAQGVGAVRCQKVYTAAAAAARRVPLLFPDYHPPIHPRAKGGATFPPRARLCAHVTIWTLLIGADPPPNSESPHSDRRHPTPPHSNTLHCKNSSTLVVQEEYIL